MITIRELKNPDWSAVWALMKPIIRKGETYPYNPEMTSEEACRMWVSSTQVVYVAEDDSGSILGSYYVKPNQPTLGAQVANCGYIVGESSRGCGIATLMCDHSQKEAIKLGYRAMQFNLVVETNEVSVYLWQKMGFTIVGKLPQAFKHLEYGYVDAYIMFKALIED